MDDMWDESLVVLKEQKLVDEWVDQSGDESDAKKIGKKVLAVCLVES